MSVLEFTHRIHGDSLHNQMCFQLKNHIKKNGGEVLPTRVFKDRKCPCEPDVYFSWDEVLRVGNTKRHVKQYGIAEVETNATKESIELKKQQYERSLAGVKLYIFELNDLEPEQWKDWTHLAKVAEKGLPL